MVKDRTTDAGKNRQRDQELLANANPEKDQGRPRPSLRLPETRSFFPWAHQRSDFRPPGCCRGSELLRLQRRRSPGLQSSLYRSQRRLLDSRGFLVHAALLQRTLELNFLFILFSLIFLHYLHIGSSRSLCIFLDLMDQNKTFPGYDHH